MVNVRYNGQCYFGLSIPGANSDGQCYRRLSMLLTMVNYRSEGGI